MLEGHLPQAPDTFGLNPPSQLAIPLSVITGSLTVEDEGVTKAPGQKPQTKLRVKRCVSEHCASFGRTFFCIIFGRLLRS